MSLSFCVCSFVYHSAISQIIQEFQGSDMIFCCFWQVKQMEQAQNCLLPMGVTSENVAHRFGVTRQEQDQAAVS